MTTIIIPKVERGRCYRLVDGKEVLVLRIQTFPDREQLGEVRTTCTVKVTGGPGAGYGANAGPDSWQDGRELTFDRPALVAQVVEELPIDGGPSTGPAEPAGSEQGELL